MQSYSWQDSNRSIPSEIINLSKLELKRPDVTRGSESLSQSITQVDLGLGTTAQLLRGEGASIKLDLNSVEAPPLILFVTEDGMYHMLQGLGSQRVASYCMFDAVSKCGSGMYSNSKRFKISNLESSELSIGKPFKLDGEYKTKGVIAIYNFSEMKEPVGETLMQDSILASWICSEMSSYGVSSILQIIIQRRFCRDESLGVLRIGNMLYSSGPAVTVNIDPTKFTHQSENTLRNIVAPIPVEVRALLSSCIERLRSPMNRKMEALRTDFSLASDGICSMVLASDTLANQDLYKNISQPSILQLIHPLLKFDIGKFREVFVQYKGAREILASRKETQRRGLPIVPPDTILIGIKDINSPVKYEIESAALPFRVAFYADSDAEALNF